MAIDPKLLLERLMADAGRANIAYLFAPRPHDRPRCIPLPAPADTENAFGIEIELDGEDDPKNEHCIDFAHQYAHAIRLKNKEERSLVTERRQRLMREMPEDAMRGVDHQKAFVDEEQDAWQAAEKALRDHGFDGWTTFRRMRDGSLEAIRSLTTDQP
jgi:hypothetical protein